MWYLAGDIGGTHTRLLARQVVDNKIIKQHESDYDSQAFDGLLFILKHFITEHEMSTISSACFAVAGPVQDGHARITNLPWQVRAADIANALRTDAILLINDFAGVAHGISELANQDLLTLQATKPQENGTRLVLGAGTGLGMAIIDRSCGDDHVIETEAGHVSFAPVDDEQFALLQYWRARIGRVTNETFLSGKGIARIFDFYQANSPDKAAKPLLEGMKQDDPAAVINTYATKFKDPVALKTMQCFADIYAAVAGDMALACKATGGVYLAGGIAPNALAFLQSDRFVQRFNDKAPMQALMATMPVQVVLNTSVGLLGAMKKAINLVE